MDIKRGFLLLLCLFISIFTYAQGGGSFDTLRNYQPYEHYISLSKKILDSVKRNEHYTIDKFSRRPNFSEDEKHLKSDLLWANKLLQDNENGGLMYVVLKQSELPSPYTFKETSLCVTYFLGYSNCGDPAFKNRITIAFSDVSKNETNYEFRFDNCIEHTKLVKAISDLPPPVKSN